MKKIILCCFAITLLWVIGCGDDSSNTCDGPPVVSAGADITLVGETSVTLTGTTSENEGTWSIQEGQGGEIQNGTVVTFTGELKHTYKLKWKSTNDCGTSSDDVNITFNVSCGDDQAIETIVDGIHWIEQACFKIEASPFTLYTDPYDPNSTIQKDTADIILISHSHGDHFSASAMDKLSGPNTIIIAPQDVVYSGTYGKRVVLKPGEQYNAFGCVNIKAVPAYNINKTSFHPKANNWVGYLITINGVTIYHAGDTERIPEMKTFTCDIAMLPLGQTYTFDTVIDAVEAAKDVQAKVAIPMHFGVYEGTTDDALSFKNQLDGIIPVVIKEKGN